MGEVEVVCDKCGTYFELPGSSDDDVVFGKCWHCGHEGEHMVADSGDDDE